MIDMATPEERRQLVRSGLDAIEPLEGATVEELRAYQTVLQNAYAAASALRGASNHEHERSVLEEDMEIFEKRFNRVGERLKPTAS